MQDVFHPGLEQDFEFDQFQRNHPRQQDAWPVFNSETEDVPPNSIVEVTGFCKLDGTNGRGPLLRIRKPAGDSLPQVLVAESPIAARSPGIARLDMRDGGLVIAYDFLDGGTPAPGGTLGSKKGSWKGKSGNLGFAVYAVDDAAQEYYQDTLIDIPEEMRYRAFVRVCCGVSGFACSDCCTDTNLRNFKLFLEGFTGDCAAKNGEFTLSGGTPFGDQIVPGTTLNVDCDGWFGSGGAIYCSNEAQWVVVASHGGTADGGFATGIQFGCLVADPEGTSVAGDGTWEGAGDCAGQSGMFLATIKLCTVEMVVSGFTGGCVGYNGVNTLAHANIPAGHIVAGTIPSTIYCWTGAAGSVYKSTTGGWYVVVGSATNGGVASGAPISPSHSEDGTHAAGVGALIGVGSCLGQTAATASLALGSC